MRWGGGAVWGERGGRESCKGGGGLRGGRGGADGERETGDALSMHGSRKK